MILIPLWVEKELLEGLIFRARGKGIYNSSHVELRAAVTEPFAIALDNALAHEHLLKYRDILLDDNRFMNKELISQSVDEIIGGNSGRRNVLETVQQVVPLVRAV